MATGITESTVEEIKARIDLADLISSYGVQVKTAGASKKACCPFHNEKTPSFNINENKGFYHCFGCGESGDAIKFVQKMEGLTFVEAVKKLAGKCGVKITEREDPEAGKRKRLYALMTELSQFYHRCLGKMKEAEIAREYLSKRDLDESVQEDFMIGYAPRGYAPMKKWAEKYGYTEAEMEAAGVIKAPRDARDAGYHRFGGRLMFSIRDKQGRVVAFSGRQLVESKNSGKYVNSPETVIFKKSNVLFGFDKAAGNIAKSQHREAIVCEGQIDTIRLHISGFPVAVASQGTAFTEEHARMLKKVADQAVLVFDDDAAGHKATVRTAGLFLAEEMPVRVVSLPEGDDPDSFLRKHKAEDFQRLLDGAESIVSFQVRSERAKEMKPDSIDAMARVSRAVLTTISFASSAVIRASMLAEAAKLLKLPVMALADELEKLKAGTPTKRKAMVGEVDYFEDEATEEDSVAMPGEDAAKAIPPGATATALCAFLMANDGDPQIDGEIGEFLPAEVFGHELPAKFVEAWRLETAGNSGAMVKFAESLDESGRKWLGQIQLDGVKTQASELSGVEIMHDFVRRLWIEELTRRRGSLSSGSDENDSRRSMELLLNLKRLQRVRWHEVKEIIRKFIKGD